MESENPNLCNEHNTKSAKQKNKRKKHKNHSNIYDNKQEKRKCCVSMFFFVSRWKKIATTTAITRLNQFRMIVYMLDVYDDGARYILNNLSVLSFPFLLKFCFYVFLFYLLFVHCFLFIRSTWLSSLFVCIRSTFAIWMHFMQLPVYIWLTYSFVSRRFSCT